MKITLILLICSLTATLAFSRGGGAGGGRSHSNRFSNIGRSASVHSFHSAPKVQTRPSMSIRPAPRPMIIAPKPHFKPAVNIRPKPISLPKVISKPVVHKPISLPKPVVKPVVHKPISLPKPVPKPVVHKLISLPKPVPQPVVHKPISLSKPVPKPQIKPVQAPKIVPKPLIKTPPVQVKPPTKVVAPKPVAKPAVVKPLVKTPPVKPPTKVTVPKPQPVKPAVVKQPVKTSPVQVKPPTKIAVPKPQPLKPAVVKQPVKAPIVKAPPKTEPKTQITASVKTGSGQGVDKKIEVNRQIFESKNGRHSIDATAGVTKHTGGAQGSTKKDVNLGAQYNYNSDKTQITASATGGPGKGVDLSATAQQNLLTSKNGRHTVDATAGVSKHLGGPQGNTKTDFDLGAQYNFNSPKTQITAAANGKPGQGVDLSVNGQHKLFESQNKRHSLEATAGVSKHMGGLEGNTKLDLSIGGQYKYEGPKTQITTSVNGGPNKGVQLGIDAKQNIWESNNKQTTIDITGGASKQLGGPNGSGKPEGHIGIEVNSKF